MMNPDLETTKAGVMSLAAKAFEARERFMMLQMVNTPTDYDARQKAFIELELARLELNNAERALRSLNPSQEA